MTDPRVRIKLIPFAGAGGTHPLKEEAVEDLGVAFILEFLTSEDKALLGARTRDQVLLSSPYLEPLTRLLTDADWEKIKEGQEVMLS